MHGRLCHVLSGFVVVFACLLVACSPFPAPPEPTAPVPTPTPLPSPRPTAPPPVTSLPQPTAAPGALTLWAVVAEPQREAFQRLLSEAARETGAELVAVPKSADALQADIRANVLAGLPPPDLIWGSQEDLGLLLRSDLLQPADDGLDSAAFLPATITGAAINGKRWGTPVAAQGYLLLLYNKKLVASAPATTDELIVQSRVLTGGDQYGLTAGWAEPRWFAAWLNGFGGTAVNSEGAVSLDTPQTISALNLLKELRVAGPPPPSTYAQGGTLFAQGRVAFALDGDWSLATYRQYSDTLDLGIAPMPVVPATGRPAAAPLNGVYVMYSSRLRGLRLQQARALGLALTRPAKQARIARDLVLLPALKAALTGPDVQSNPALAAAATQAQEAEGLPPARELRCAWDALRASLPAVLLGEVAQEDAAQQMQAQATACVARAG